MGCTRRTYEPRKSRKRVRPENGLGGAASFFVAGEEAADLTTRNLWRSARGFWWWEMRLWKGGGKEMIQVSGIIHIFVNSKLIVAHG